MMIQPINRSVFMSMMLDNTTDSVSTQSLESTVRSLYAQYSVEVQNKKEALFHQADTIDVSNPIDVMNMQNSIAQYSLGLNFVSTLTHKATGAIDTLLKAQ
ncbi:TPA: type III secretion system inner rod subunit SctI [Providencia stuartii]|uniref:Type III secretion apparatus protein, YscI/HrpB domain protein n=2 Tax=Providencia stuartii TaxID=588 RepID=A0AA87CRT5_PROST|nr:MULTISPECIES: type III secretion system inner rod subunit SctI [Providencia]APG51788.1 virulence associated protein [Providencia stuartii]AXO19163.1 virulence associated protein [Providencia stuartii]EDU57885.1 putative type III secretion apparatus protein, YscI/HrpB domain protein [Providencia stuartii ATCC 25827]EMD1717146.1 type III secretion system inner rod subunit SctI [Providencia stuartii]EMF0918493.1 type III secretion system inner rod subunit SctI [Providencia stuartii]